MAVPAYDLIDDPEDTTKRDAIVQGKAFRWSLRYRSPDLAGTTAADWTARMQVRHGYADLDSTVLLNLAVGSGITLTRGSDTEGEYLLLSIFAGATATQALPGGTHRYDVEAAPMSNLEDVRELGWGKAQVRREVTR